jgi:hypothetical protein
MTVCPPTPTEDRLPACRRACLAYREIREAGGNDQEAYEAAVAAVQSVLTQLSWKEARAEAVNAIAYATKCIAGDYAPIGATISCLSLWTVPVPNPVRHATLPMPTPLLRIGLLQFEVSDGGRRHTGGLCQG